MAADANANLLKALVSGETEVGGLLQRLYQSYEPGRAVVVSASCGGCPVHRREGAAKLDYVEPVVFGVGRSSEQDLAAWRERFSHLSQARTVFLVLPDPLDTTLVASILQDAVALFNVQEIAVSSRLRTQMPILQGLHKHAAARLLMLQNIDEEAVTPPRYPVIRASVVSEGGVPPYLIELDRPLHIIIAPASTPDPWHPGRLLGDVGSNILTLEQFRSGSRQ